MSRPDQDLIVNNVLDLIDQASQPYWRLQSRHKESTDMALLNVRINSLLLAINEVMYLQAEALLKSKMEKQHINNFRCFYTVFNDSQKKLASGFVQFAADLKLDSKLEIKFYVDQLKKIQRGLVTLSVLLLVFGAASLVSLILLSIGVLSLPIAEITLLGICIASWTLFSLSSIGGSLLANFIAAETNLISLPETISEDNNLFVEGVEAVPQMLSPFPSAKKPLTIRAVGKTSVGDNEEDARINTPSSPMLGNEKKMEEEVAALRRSGIPKPLPQKTPERRARSNSGSGLVASVRFAPNPNSIWASPKARSHTPAISEDSGDSMAPPRAFFPG
ncbi:MAG TPA: hypothetical protein VD770_00125 [Coxiellaceae bacterium]|nr:hypothetical protein [Coxiellaceae bacterium]